jgi:hypothetical protein
MLERLGKVSGWVGTSFALLAFVFAFMKWSPGHGEPFYFGVLAAVLFFLIGQAVRYVLVALALSGHCAHLGSLFDVETTPAMTAEDAHGTFVSAGRAAKAFRSAGRA